MPDAERKTARTTLGLLLVIYVVNHIDRQVMYILAEDVKADLLISDAQLGWLMGGAFAIFYTFAGLPIARLADRGNRTRIITISLLLWSAMTVASGTARGFMGLLAARVGVGVGEAGCTPPAHSMISDVFPPEKRASALSTYSLGVPLGTLFGLAAGGYLAQELGWRSAFFVVGVPGVFLALIAKLYLREPERGRFDTDTDLQQDSLARTFSFIVGLGAMRHVLIATALQTLFLAGAGAFHASFLRRVHGLSGSEAGLTLGLVAGFAGGFSVLAAGWMADRLGTRDVRWHFWIPAIGALVSLPFSFVAYSTGNTSLAVAMIAVATVFNHAYSGLTHTIMQGLVKPRMRATMSAVALFTMNLVGFGEGPVLLGVLSDAYGAEGGLSAALRMLLVFLAWSILHYVLGARSYARDLNAKISSSLSTA